MLTRREFHCRLLAALAATALPRPALVTTPAAILYPNRLTFGATPDDRIAYDAGNDENGHSWPATDQLRPLTALHTEPADLLNCIDWEQGMDYAERARPAQEVIAAAMIRAVHAPAQLREVMTQFWHDHFRVNVQKDEFCAAFFASHDADLRENAFGNFRVLLGLISRSPAMLYYLNNADSRAPMGDGRRRTGVGHAGPPPRHRAVPLHQNRPAVAGRSTRSSPR